MARIPRPPESVLTRGAALPCRDRENRPAFGTEVSRGDVWRTVRRRVRNPSCHTLLTTGITDDLTNGRRIEVAQRMAGYSNTTGFYVRRSGDISVVKLKGLVLDLWCTQGKVLNSKA